MASNAHRRRGQHKKQQLSRQNSTFLDAIKNIVTAPFAWFTANDQFEDTKGKRRRLPEHSSQLSQEDEFLSPRAKRPRVEPVQGSSMGYLDPPSHAFSTESITNSVRSLGISRTMSLDPPAHPLKRESAIAQLSVPHRDLSMPPMSHSTRPSFLSRSSLTPQPSLSAARDTSEPPPLSSLVLNPVFVRAPSSQPAESHQRTSAETITLGTLADSTRSARSPVRQHSSLLFSTSTSSKVKTSRQQSPAEKALHELDIYKTPLLPTRLRSFADITHSTTPGTPGLFKSRRAHKLVLMQDEKPSTRLGMERKNTNDTKPYAGEGGMKKLLTRRKLEVSEESEREDIEDGGSQSKSPSLPEPTSGPAIDKADWFQLASSNNTSTSASSLRVGRDKKRHHIARPKAKSARPKFSAAFDDDFDDAVDGEFPAEVKSTTPNKTFTFTPPPGFSFAKEDSKELPITSLPFSLTNKLQDPSVDVSKPSHISLTSSTVGQVPSDARPSSVPDFFAKSSVLSQPLDIAVPSQAFRLIPAVRQEPADTAIDGPSVPAVTTKLLPQTRSFADDGSETLGPASSPAWIETKRVMEPVISIGPKLETNAASISFGATLSPPPTSDAKQSGEVQDPINVSKAHSLFDHVIDKTSDTFEPSGASIPFNYAPPITNVEPPKSPFTLTSEPTTPKPFGTTAQTVGAPEKDKLQTTSEANFVFGTAPSTSTQSEQKKAPPSFAFSASQSIPTSSNTFSFGGGGSVGSDVSKPFALGTPVVPPPERPVTPPKVHDQEVQMEESPTRDVQPSDGKPPATLGFSFGAAATTGGVFDALNGTTSSPFAFASSTNSFVTSSAKEDKLIENKPSSFARQSSTFSFGNNSVDMAAPAQSTTNSPFSFGSSFTFGSQTTPSNNPFGQSQTGSAPSSPATFGSGPFSFGAPANTGFSFGTSQPTSPAGGNNLVLPQPSSGFGNSGFGQSAPPSPFSASSPLTASAPSPTLFTIGSAPTGTSRQIKKLPTRRGGAKR